jgi:uncharacterized protein YndB with AHSA1/START domain
VSVVLEVVRERWIGAAPDRIWPLVDEPARLSEWFSFADRIEPLSGTGVGRRQRLHGRWGRKRSEVDQLVTAHEPPRLLQWRHEAERLDGKPAPQFARETVFTIRLEPSGAGTDVRLESRQQPASAVKGLVMRLFGTREVAQHLDRSLDHLARVATTAPPPP